MLRLTRACADLCIMAGPVALAVVVVIGTIVFWPGMLIGLPILLVIGWFCQKQAVKIRREHDG